jgi:accessory colonization factor AcfC
LVEKRDMRMIRSFADLTDEEIAALVSEGEADASGIGH